jgi:ribose transport system permease protein
LSLPKTPAEPSGAPPSGAARGMSASPKRRAHSLVQRLMASREFSVVIVLALICVYMAFSSSRDAFFSQRNLQNILRNVGLLGVFAIGETIVIIAAGIDLSLGSLIAFTGMLMAMLLTRFDASLVPGGSLTLAIIVTLVASFLIGGTHATFIHRLKLPPFVVTLASLQLLRSQALLMNNQLPVPIMKAQHPALDFLANGNLFEGSVFPVPMPVVILAVVATAAALILNRARIGRYLYSLGSNEQATALSGVNVYRIKLFAYGVSALLGGVAGILWASYGGQGDPRAANAYELDAVAASVVGGASLAGGQGSVSGTVLGATLLWVIFSAINLTLDKPDLWRGTVVGGVLLFAVLVTALQQRRAT